MARKTIGTLNTAITADAQKYVDEFKRAQQATKDGVSAISASLKSLGSGLAASLGIGAVLSFGKSVVDLGSQITDLSIVANMGSQEFQTIAVTAMDSGLAFEQTAKAAENMRAKIEDAAKGNAAAVATFKALNLSAVGLQALAPERQWEVIARAITGAKDQQAALNAASDIFGAKIAPKLRETLALLATEGFDKMGDSTKALRFSQDQLDTLDKAGDAMGRIWHYVKLMGATPIVAVTKLLANENALASARKNLIRLESQGQGNDTVARDLRIQIADMEKFAAAAESSKKALEEMSGESRHVEQMIREQAMNEAISAEEFGRGIADRAIAAKQAARVDSFLQSTLQKAIAGTSAATTKLTEEQVALGEKMEEAALSPLARYTKEIERVNGLEEAGIITTDAAAHAIGVAGEAYVKAEGDLEDYASRVRAAADDHSTFSKSGDEFSRDMEQMWGRVADNAADAMAEILLNGENTFEELGRVIVKTMLSAAIKAQLIMPLMNFIGGTGGIAPGIFGKFDGMKAGGGPVSGGKSYLVGEEGPEMFSPSTSGTITPNRTLANAAGGGGDNFVFNYSFTSGITKAELLPFLTLTQRTTLAKIADVRRRGGSNAVAFA
jgi:hypothetical protein